MYFFKQNIVQNLTNRKFKTESVVTGEQITPDPLFVRYFFTRF